MELDVLLLDIPGGPALIGDDEPVVVERPGDPTSSVWILCDIELANHRHLLGAVRITPPQEYLGAPKITRTTGILALVGDVAVDLLVGGERARAGLAAHETVPFRLRLRRDPPDFAYEPESRDPRFPLEMGTWTRGLDPVDLAGDVARLAPLAW